MSARSLRTALVAGAVVLALAACGTSGSSETSSSTSAAAASLDKITVADAGEKKAPTVTLPAKPFSVSTTATKVVKEGSGEALTTGHVATVSMEVLNGKDGSVVNSTYETGQGVGFYLGQADMLKGLVKGLTGQKVGSRVLIAVPPADGFGAQGQSQLEIGATDTMVFLIDITSASVMLSEATGTAVAPVAGLPTVEFVKDARAKITAPAKAKPPAKLVVQPLIKGKGPAVKAGQTVRVTYTGSLWRNNEIFDSSFDHDGTFEFPAGGGRVIKAWDTGVVGQTVGSRLLLVVPPADGYGAAGSPPKIAGTDTLVFVVDVLAAY